MIHDDLSCHYLHFSKFFILSIVPLLDPDTMAPEAKTAAKKNSLLANAASSAIGGIVHACIEQPITTPVEASITQMQINGKGFFANFKELYSRGIWNGLYRAFPTAMAGAAPKAVVHYG